jgi:hypothetical protein
VSAEKLTLRDTEPMVGGNSADVEARRENLGCGAGHASDSLCAESVSGSSGEAIGRPALLKGEGM